MTTTPASEPTTPEPASPTPATPGTPAPSGAAAVPPVPGPPTSRLGAYAAGIAAVVGLELRQRLRSRGWYVLLAVWFVVIGGVTGLTWWSWSVQNHNASTFASDGLLTGPAGIIFELVLAFVLLFGLLVAPALSANAINGDRASGTLAILSVTLLRPGQLLWGKFLASWLAGMAFLAVSVPFLIVGIAHGGLGIGHILVALLMLSIELAVVCALGVGISALANRPLFSIVVTYLVVATLAVGTLLSFGLGALASEGPVLANEVHYKNTYASLDGKVAPATSNPPQVTDENDEYACYGPLREVETTRTDRVAWLLAMNPFVIVADAIPYTPRRDVTPDLANTQPSAVFEAMSQGARMAQAGPDGTYPCANGKVTPYYLQQSTPLWPLGLNLQLLVTAGVLALGWRALRTPAGKLAQGTRIA